MIDLKSLVYNYNLNGLEASLKEYPQLANEGIPFDEINLTLAHPLHRISDAVFAHRITDDQALELATLFIKYGSHVDGIAIQDLKDSPLIAACSLHVDKVALLLIEKGANIHHTGTHGGTALHWSAWCGRPKLLKHLIESGAEINRLCIDFKATPLFWAVHGLLNDTSGNLTDHEKCLKLLLDHGADKNIPNIEGKTVFDLIGDSKFDYLLPLHFKN